jgi:hypothetical protein
LTVILVKRVQGIKVYVRYTVPPSEKERIISEPRAKRLYPAARVGLGTGFDEVDDPVRPLQMDLGVPISVCTVGATTVVGHLGAPVANNISQISQRDDELPVVISGIMEHDVPQEWRTTYRDHRFGTQVRFLRQALTAPSCQYPDFHRFAPHMPWIFSVGLASVQGCPQQAHCISASETDKWLYNLR